MSKIATVSDEAFAYLLIENYWNEWSTKNLVEYLGERCCDSSISKRKKEGQYEENTQREFGEHDNMLGGIRIVRFNQLCEQVKEDRQKCYHRRAVQNTLFDNCGYTQKRKQVKSHN